MCLLISLRFKIHFPLKQHYKWGERGNKEKSSLLGPSLPLHHTESATGRESMEKGGGAAHSKVNISQKLPKQAALRSTKIKKLWQEVGEMPLLLICADLYI